MSIQLYVKQGRRLKLTSELDIRHKGFGEGSPRYQVAQEAEGGARPELGHHVATPMDGDEGQVVLVVHDLSPELRASLHQGEGWTEEERLWGTPYRKGIVPS